MQTGFYASMVNADGESITNPRIRIKHIIFLKNCVRRKKKLNAAHPRTDWEYS